MSSSSSPQPEKKSKGRQKIEMKKMSKESNLQVTFSKRRTGLFKKASELCTLCGADVGLIIFSPGEKAFSFGHPNVEVVVERYLNGGALQPRTTSTQFMEAHRNANLRELNAQLKEVMAQLEAEKKRGEELNKKRKEIEEQCWWAGPYDALTREQLVSVRARLEEMKRFIARETDRALIQMAANNANRTPPLQFYAGSSSSCPAPPLQPPQVAAPLLPAQVFAPPQPPMIQNPVFDGNMLPLLPQPQPLPLPPSSRFRPFENSMGGYGGPGYPYY